MLRVVCKFCLSRPMWRPLEQGTDCWALLPPIFPGIVWDPVSLLLRTVDVLARLVFLFARQMHVVVAGLLNRVLMTP